MNFINPSDKDSRTMLTMMLKISWFRLKVLVNDFGHIYNNFLHLYSVRLYYLIEKSEIIWGNSVKQ